MIRWARRLVLDHAGAGHRDKPVTRLIPRLDIRVAAIIAGEEVPRSHLHSVYAATEFAKAVALLLGVIPRWERKKLMVLSNDLLPSSAVSG